MHFELDRKSNDLKCFLIRLFRKKLIPGNNCSYITIFHDYERQYCSSAVTHFSDKGVERLLDIESKYKIKVTYNIVGKLIQDVPSIVRRILADGHEIASHSYEHSIIPKLTTKEMLDDINKTKDIFRSCGIALKGIRSPQSRWSFQQMNILLDSGLQWTAENDHGKYPYVIKNKNSTYLIRMPVTMDDWGYESLHETPEQMLRKLRACVDKICRKKYYGAIGFHPWVQGKDDGRITVFEEFIAELSEREDLVLMPFTEACAVHSKQLSKE